MLVVLLLAANLSACGSKRESYPQAHPIVERTDLTPLHDAIERVRDDIERLRATREGDELSQKILDDANSHLDDIRYYFVPLSSARESVLNALRESWGNNVARRDSFLSHARGQLMSVMEHAGPQIDKMVEVQLEMLTDIEAEARAGEDVRERIEALATEIQHALTVAPLVLDENRYHNPAGE